MQFNVLLVTLCTGYCMLVLCIDATVRHYTDPIDCHTLAHVVAVIALTCGTTAVLMLPLDVASTGLNAEQWIHGYIESAYIMLDQLMLALALLVLPFSFFFVAPENDLDVSKPRTAVQKTLAAMRNTLLLAAAIAVRRRSSSKHDARTPALGALLLRLPRHAS